MRKGESIPKSQEMTSADTGFTGTFHDGSRRARALGQSAEPWSGQVLDVIGQRGDDGQGVRGWKTVCGRVQFPGRPYLSPYSSGG